MPLGLGGGAGGVGGLLPSLADRLRAQSLLLMVDAARGQRLLAPQQSRLREYIVQRLRNDMQPQVELHVAQLRHIALGMQPQQQQQRDGSVAEAVMQLASPQIELPLLDQFRRESALALQEQAAHIAEVILARCLVDTVDAVVRSGIRSTVDILSALN